MPDDRPRRPAAPSKYDWDSLYAEWIASGLTANKFRESKGIDKRTFYNAVEKHRWWEKAEAIKARAVARVEDAQVDAAVERWKEQEKLWRAVEVQAASILRRTIGDDGRITRPLKPGELATLTAALERALKARRLIAGESTENTAVKGSLHPDLVKLVLRQRRAERLMGLPPTPRDVTPQRDAPPETPEGA